MSGETPKGRRPARPGPAKSSAFEIELRLRNVEERLRMGLTPAEVILELTSDHNQFCNRPDVPPCTRHLRLSKRTAVKDAPGALGSALVQSTSSV